MHLHPDYKKFLGVLQGALPAAASFHGTLYRACDPMYANTRDLLSGQGSRNDGGRWNARGSFATVYLAQSVDGALAETLGLAGYFGFDPLARLPLTLVAVEAHLGAVLDFTDARLRKLLGITLGALNKCDWRSENAAGREAVCQALGRAAFKSGASGIIVASAVMRRFRNLNIFPANLSGTGDLRIIGSEKLPPPAPGII